MGQLEEILNQIAGSSASSSSFSCTEDDHSRSRTPSAYSMVTIETKSSTKRTSGYEPMEEQGSSGTPLDEQWDALSPSVVTALPLEAHNSVMVKCADKAIGHPPEVEVDAMAKVQAWVNAAPDPIALPLDPPSPPPLVSSSSALSFIDMDLNHGIQPVLARLALWIHNLDPDASSFPHPVNVDLKALYDHVLYKVKGRELIPLNFGTHLMVLGPFLPTFLAKLLVKIETTKHNHENLLSLYSYWAVRLSDGQKRRCIKEYAVFTKKCNLVKLALLLAYLEVDPHFWATADLDRLWQWAAPCPTSLESHMQKMLEIRGWSEAEKLEILAHSPFYHEGFSRRCVRSLDPGCVLQIVKTVSSAQNRALPEGYQLAAFPDRVDKVVKARVLGLITRA